MRTQPGPSPLRLAIYLIACILLGTVTTLGIAWACAAWVDAVGAVSVFSSAELTEADIQKLVARSRGTAAGTVTTTGGNIFVPHQPGGPTVAYRTQTTQRAFGNTRINRLTSNMRFDVQNGSVIVSGGGAGNALALSGSPVCEAIGRAGWPWRAFECSMPVARISTPNVSMMITNGPAVVEGGFELSPDASGGWRALPYRPVWGGLIGNVVLFSGLWFGVLLVPGMLKRRGRRKRGECIACGYDLRGVANERCPECGVEHGRGFAAAEGDSVGVEPRMNADERGWDEGGETPKSENAELPKRGYAAVRSAGVPPAGQIPGQCDDDGTSAVLGEEQSGVPREDRPTPAIREVPPGGAGGEREGGQ